MVFPKNGRVVVFDDSYDEVKELLKALSSNVIPFLYFQDESGDDLPEKPIPGIRLVILDLRLITSGPESTQNVIATIASRLDRVMEKKNAYFLVYWSTKEGEYKEALNHAFDNQLSDYKPLVALSLNKSEALSNGDKVFDYLKAKLVEEISSISALKPYLFWENVISKSTSDLITELLSVVPKDRLLNENLKSLINRLSNASFGKRAVNLGYTSKRKLSGALLSLNQVHIDQIESYITHTEFNFDTDDIFAFDEKVTAIDSNYLNSKLLVSSGDTVDGLEPGSVFVISGENLKANIEYEEKSLELWQHWVRNCEKLKTKFGDKVKSIKDRNVEFIKDLHQAYISRYMEIFDSITNGDHPDIFANSIPIELNITPICDYAQDKMPVCRIIPGFFVKESVFREGCFNKNSPAVYIAPAPVYYSEEAYRFVFSFQYLFSVAEVCLKGRRPSIKIRQQLLTDIQSKLGSHISRPAVLVVT